ncbi:hypothetical protein [Streptococcus henryi]|nr:hypothetical protein [Streptococcus henryi]
MREHYYYFTVITSGKNNQNTIYRYKKHVLYPIND